MRFLENLFVKLFSLIIFCLSIVIVLIGFDILELNFMNTIVKYLYATELRGKITIIVCLVFILVSLKIFFTSRRKPRDGKDGIVLENSSGKLIISRESLDNLIANASKDVPGAENITSKTYLDLEQNLRVFVTVTITQDVSIKELSTSLQTKIKSAIKQTADLDVSEVNVKIKNIVNKKSRRIKDSYETKKEEPKVEIITEPEVSNESSEEIESNKE